MKFAMKPEMARHRYAGRSIRDLEKAGWGARLELKSIDAARQPRGKPLSQKVTLTSKIAIGDRFRIQKGDAVWLTAPAGWERGGGSGRDGGGQERVVFEGSLLEACERKVVVVVEGKIDDARGRQKIDDARGKIDDARGRQGGEGRMVEDKKTLADEGKDSVADDAKKEGMGVKGKEGGKGNGKVGKGEKSKSKLNAKQDSDVGDEEFWRIDKGPNRTSYTRQLASLVTLVTTCQQKATDTDVVNIIVNGQVGLLVRKRSIYIHTLTHICKRICIR